MNPWTVLGDWTSFDLDLAGVNFEEVSSVWSRSNLNPLLFDLRLLDKKLSKSLFMRMTDVLSPGEFIL